MRDASAHMLQGVRAIGTEDVAIDDALGRVLATHVISTIFLPPRDNSSMDGFAVHADDVRGASALASRELRVIGTIAAGSSPTRALASGEAARIMTGAYVPDGADSVIRVEDTTSVSQDADVVTIVDARDAGRNIRRRGEDVRVGAVVLRAGTLLGAAHVGVLASIGHARPQVYRRPRVAILATGDELVALEHFSQVLSGDRIVSSNSYALAAAVRAAGGEPVPLGISPDDPAILADRLREADGCDLVLTSGGVSVGDFDYTRRVVSELGGSLSLWRVRMRPGAPLGFGELFGVPWLGLPGNPVSALVTFELFGRPLLRTLGGHARPHRRTIMVETAEPTELGAPLTHFLRVVLGNGSGPYPLARVTGSQSSGILTSMSAADALLIVPPEPQSLAAGAKLRALPLDGDLGGSEVFLD
ncbi:MAG: molybdopterin molybdotransferase MoeA [Gemmatimonadota bacterium]|nr:molybdopterin molybdotransferase MoeA [Gemmatimonadota bacterium]